MLELGAELESRDLAKQPLSERELGALIGRRDYKKFLNSRNEMYRARKMAEKPPTRTQAIRLMVKNPNLIKRPIVVRGDSVILGFDVPAYMKLMS